MILVVAVALGLLTGPVMADPVAPVLARFTDPTDRYPHNVLGDLPGFGALEVTVGTGTTLRLVLPEPRVFEDIVPRLWDIDGDGTPEIVAVESDQRLGARLTAWSGSGAAPNGASPHHRNNRRGLHHPP